MRILGYLVALVVVVYFWGWRQLQDGQYPWIGAAVVAGGFVAVVWLLLSMASFPR
jgi:hypothetical protein